MQKLTFIALVVVFTAFLAVGIVLALPSLPDKVPQVTRTASPAISESGELQAPPQFVAQLPENELTKIVFVRYAPAREPAECGNNICEPKEKKSCPSDCQEGGEEEPSACYGFLAGAKPHWNWIEDYYYDNASLGASSTAVAVIWEGATSGDIFGNGVLGAGAWGDYDYKNSVVFGDYDDTGMCPNADPCVIGVTSIWFRGKNIYEYDILFDTDFFPGSIDLNTVVLHEIGHGAGLNDLYNESCATEVMYGIYDGIDLDLGPGDVEGIQKMYGI